MKRLFVAILFAKYNFLYYDIRSKFLSYYNKYGTGNGSEHNGQQCYQLIFTENSQKYPKVAKNAKIAKNIQIFSMEITEFFCHSDFT